MQNITYLIDKYYPIVNDICNTNGYDNNIRHLLYVIMPAFAVKYGSTYENVLLKCFKETTVLVGKEVNTNIEAFFDRKLFNFGDTFFSKKFIVINGLVKSEYIYLIDSIVHEYNHAINSINNEIEYNNKEIFLRTGLSYLEYNNNQCKKSKSYILEELVNTRQSEEIVSIIYNMEYRGNNSEIKSLLEAIRNEKNQNDFKSNAYSFYMDCCRDLIDNKTFIKNAELYRLNGNVKELELFFDGIIGENGSYNKLNELLYNTDELLYKYDKSFFSFIIRKEIKNNIDKIKMIINEFCSSTVFK